MNEVDILNIKAKPYLFSILFIIICVFNIECVISGMQKALSICAYSIIPSLFIFTVLSDITVSLLIRDIQSVFSPKLILFLLGSLCGFPVGATVCERFLHIGAISETDAKKFLPFCNIASPAFVIGAIGIAMFGDKQIGFLLYFSLLITSSIPLFFIKCEKQKINIHNGFSISNIYFSAVENSVNSILKICALICIFTAFLSLIENTVFKFIALIIEVSCGCSLSASLFAVSPLMSISICGFCLGFSGLCVHAQVISIAKSIKFNYLKFFITKLFQGIFCSALSTVGYYLFFTLEL